YKQGTYYPFVPSGDHRRDNAAELSLSALAKEDLPIEPNLSSWFPLWGLPV
ncbi:MAG: PspA-associated protein PspAB, partial [Candidatus Dormibacteria bacterium]